MYYFSHQGGGGASTAEGGYRIFRDWERTRSLRGRGLDKDNCKYYINPKLNIETMA